MKKYAVITGASMGLGKSFALELAKRGKNLIIVSLPGEGLEKFAKDIELNYRIVVKYFEADLAEYDSVFELTDVINRNFEVDVLINNAGVGGTGNFSETSSDYIDTIIKLNVRATSLMVKQMLPNLSRQNGAYILNVASMASFSPLPLKTVYPASKAFVYFLSRSLYHELKEKNIHVSVLHPGPMKTNEDVSRRIDFQGIVGKVGLIPTDRLAHVAIKKLYDKQQVIMPGLNKFTWVLMKVLPMSLQLLIGYRITRREFYSEKLIQSCVE